MSQRQMKEAFVSNLNGTNLLEITLGLSLPPICTVCRGLLLILSQLHSTWGIHLLVDFAILVVPLVTSCTVLSPVLSLVPLILTSLGAGMFYQIYNRRNCHLRAPPRKIIQEFLKTRLEPERIPAVTHFRVFINVLTAISILAVDFPLYPRRYAKTEVYGTGVMDLGVGAFVFGNALICPEVRRGPGTGRSKFHYLARQLFSVWPLVFLGLGRLISVKSVGYHEHLSEYGVHWNFFFTLAVVKVAASLLLVLVSPHKSWVVATGLAVFYQIALDLAQLKVLLLHGSDGKGTRVGMLNANREGIFSIWGYLAIYLAGVQTGLFMLKTRTLLSDWIRAIGSLLLIVSGLFTFLHVTQDYIGPVSRRMANLAFGIWTVAQCLSFLSFLLLGDVLLVLSKFLIKGVDVPCSWNLIQSSGAVKKRETGSPTPEKERKPLNLCLIAAINRNQLLFFLLANVMTGLVNMMVDTLNSSTSWTLSLLHLYMFSNCLIMYVLHIQSVTVKWW
ncbi:phosphatidylinositol-glycan biosynthesis class W protein [Tachyglossus aculeatus]|uniref:phosphatidylinositol-glycan biosynthesis class W protein n=1 Tax=Tachyglossus aculeatus TaxID=9261 RepID=UPI0018F43232|nr:phosphatidylinositol-glycan biosynthesis class W protein [Tachyglossus aculeatus]XP_038615263.1 phosphatidylinositol-glycan biosynthesis class W protein [Tachyglossus aculeatus]XP_038615264.1 phosphatidylinositol-glycan biosynthesis class W protein [Tachyglossus aculeatus]